MLTKIENSELLTGKEAREKYADKYFIFHSEEIENMLYGQYHQDTSLVTVRYTADEKMEFMQLSEDERLAPGNGLDLGIYMETEIQIGAIVYG